MNRNFGGGESEQPPPDENEETAQESEPSDSYTQGCVKRESHFVSSGLELTTTPSAQVTTVADNENAAILDLAGALIVQEDQQALTERWISFLDEGPERTMGDINQIVQQIVDQAQCTHREELLDSRTQIRFLLNLDLALRKELRKACVHLKEHDSLVDKLNGKYLSKRISLRYRGQVEIEYDERFQTLSTQELRDYIENLEGAVSNTKDAITQITKRLQILLDGQRDILMKIQSIANILQVLARNHHRIYCE